MIAEVIKTQRTGYNVPVAVTCRTLGISQSWFYKHDGRQPTTTECKRAALDIAVAGAFGKHHGEYGSPRIHAELIEQPGLECLSVNSVAASMRRQALCGLRRRPRRCTTRPDKNGRFAPNRLKRDFKPVRPNAAWCGDITEISTWEGKVYLASVIDLYSRRLIGQSISTVADTTLVTDALKMAIATRGGDVSGVIMHTDRGSQGGFNRSSQHLDHGGCEDGDNEGATAGGPALSRTDSIAGPADGRMARRSRPILVGDLPRCEDRGRGDRSWRLGACGVSMVPSRWWREPLFIPINLGPLPVVL